MFNIRIYKNQLESFPKSYWTNKNHAFAGGFVYRWIQTTTGTYAVYAGQTQRQQAGHDWSRETGCPWSAQQTEGWGQSPRHGFGQIGKYPRGLFMRFIRRVSFKIGFSTFMQNENFCFLFLLKIPFWSYFVQKTDNGELLIILYWTIKTKELWTWTVIYTSNETGSSG